MHMSMGRVRALLRMDAAALHPLATLKADRGLLLFLWVPLLAAAAIYGSVLGCWRSGAQAGIAAVKLPLLLAAIVICSAGINYMLAALLGVKISFRQTWWFMTLALWVTSLLPASLAPVLLLFSHQCPGPESAHALPAYRGLLVGHTLVIACAGIAGHLRLYHLLRPVCGSAGQAALLLFCWMGCSGLVGSELAWVLSPFFAKPGIPVPVLNPDAFHGNFFEYLWRSMG